MKPITKNIIWFVGFFLVMAFVVYAQEYTVNLNEYMNKILGNRSTGTGNTPQVQLQKDVEENLLSFQLLELKKEFKGLANKCEKNKDCMEKAIPVIEKNLPTTTTTTTTTLKPTTTTIGQNITT